MKLIITFLAFLLSAYILNAQMLRPPIQDKTNWNMSSIQSILGSTKTVGGIGLAGYITDPTMTYRKGYGAIYDQFSFDTITSFKSSLTYENLFYSVVICEGYTPSTKSYYIPVIAAGYGESTPGDRDAYVYYEDEISGVSEFVSSQPYNQEVKHIEQQYYGTSLVNFCGYNEQSASDKDYWIGVIDAPGSTPYIMNSSTFGGTGDDVLNAFDMTESNNLVATGYTTSLPAVGKDINLIIYEPGNQMVMVDSTYVLPGDQELNSITYSDYYTAKFIGVGYTDLTGSDKDMFIVAFDEYSGDTLWTMTIGTPNEDVATSVRYVNVLSLTGFLVSGYSVNANGDKETHLYLIDPYGWIISERIYREPGTDVQINSIEALADGCNYFLFGQQDNEQTSIVSAAIDYDIEVFDALCYNDPSGEIHLLDLQSNYPQVLLYDSSYSNQIGSGYDYFGLTNGLYHVDIEYMVGGASKSICYMYDSVYVNEPDSFMLSSLIYTDPDCYDDNGEIHAVITGGTLPYTISWSTGADSLDLTGLWADTYFLSASDFNDCPIIDTNIVLSFHALPYIDGFAQTTLGNISTDRAKAILYKYGNTGGAAMLDSLDYYTIDLGNQYNFSDLDTGSYVIKIMIDSTSYYPNVMNSYYSLNDTVMTWELADVVTMNCDDTLHANVTMYEMTPMTNGAGNISGYIFLFTYSKAVGEPVPGAEILIEQEPNDIPVQSAITDNNGYYVVTGLEAGSTYQMHVEIPGYPMINTYTNIPITSTDTLYQQMNFYVDTTLNGGIMADTLQTVIAPVTFNNFSANVFPNPFYEEINIDVAINEEATVWIDAINIKGEEVKLITSEKAIKGTYLFNWTPLQNIPSGTYFLRIRVNNEVFIKKVILQK